MTSKGNQLKLVAKTIRKNGPLPVQWDCGGDETPVYFGGWGTAPGNPHRDVLSALRNEIVSVLSLPNASESSNVGKGIVSLDGGSIQLCYSLVHVAYSYFDDKLPEDFQPLKKVSVPLENYWGGDCAAYLSFDFDRTESAGKSPPQWRKKIYVTPDKNEAVVETARDYLVPFLEPMVERGKVHMLDQGKLQENEFSLTGIHFDGRFDTATQTLNYDFEYSYLFAMTVDRDETVILG